MNLVQVATAIKSLVELGGIWEVDDSWYINSSDGSPVTVDHKGSKPLRILHDNMETGDYCILNPYAEKLSLSAELRWFYDGKSVYIGHLIKQLVLDIIENKVALSEDDQKRVDKLKNLNKLSTLISEVSSNDMFAVIYIKKQKKTILQSRVLAEPSDYGLTKTQHQQLIELVDIILDGNDLSAFDTVVTFDKLPRFSSFFRCLIQLLEVIQDKVKHLPNKLELDEVREHLTNTEAYHKLAYWCISTTPAIVVEEPTKQVTANTPSPQRYTALVDAGESTNTVEINKPSGMPQARADGSRVRLEPPIGYGGQPIPNQQYMQVPGQMPNQPYMQVPGQMPNQPYMQVPGQIPNQQYMQMPNQPYMQMPNQQQPQYMQPNMGMQPAYNYTPQML